MHGWTTLHDGVRGKDDGKPGLDCVSLSACSPAGDAAKIASSVASLKRAQTTPQHHGDDLRCRAHPPPNAYDDVDYSPLVGPADWSEGK